MGLLVTNAKTLLWSTVTNGDVEAWAVAMNQRDEVRLMAVHPALTIGGGATGPRVRVRVRESETRTVGNG